ncbi:hypothetical protein [Brevibacillus thermoruber]|jgi:hypothetical protein|uniref:Uncharacterized protein n=1 Tax=Brevibacillus thermoruber TaxID=33942 RepID=A0A9X3Z517_9BACL|nr:hypothetical protein [Brevibacillus thermoruber]MDA5110551.1 hypothetical protein [Brevibacillus thermoruber]
MFQQVNRFVTQFRELEKREYARSREEERLWQSLKDKLSASPTEEQPSAVRRCIAVTGLYAQAGASFLAGNASFLLAGSGVSVTLCELPGTASYYYFALDCERRAHHRFKNSSASVLLMQSNHLRILVDTPLSNESSTPTDTADWLLRMSKESATVVIDLSSRWKEEQAVRVMDLADEIWVVFDSDLARFTRLFLTEEPPSWWEKHGDKIRLIANKWNEYLSRSAVMKKVEGTVSLWNGERFGPGIDAVVPLIDSEKTAIAHTKASLLLELYPEEEHRFQSLLHSEKGRML